MGLTWRQGVMRGHIGSSRRCCRAPAVPVRARWSVSPSGSLVWCTPVGASPVAPVLIPFPHPGGLQPVAWLLPCAVCGWCVLCAARGSDQGWGLLLLCGRFCLCAVRRGRVCVPSCRPAVAVRGHGAVCHLRAGVALSGKAVSLACARHPVGTRPGPARGRMSSYHDLSGR